MKKERILIRFRRKYMNALNWKPLIRGFAWERLPINY